MLTWKKLLEISADDELYRGLTVHVDLGWSDDEILRRVREALARIRLYDAESGGRAVVHECSECDEQEPSRST